MVLFPRIICMKNSKKLSRFKPRCLLALLGWTFEVFESARIYFTPKTFSKKASFSTNAGNSSSAISSFQLFLGKWHKIRQKPSVFFCFPFGSCHGFTYIFEQSKVFLVSFVMLRQVVFADSDPLCPLFLFTARTCWSLSSLCSWAKI